MKDISKFKSIEEKYYALWDKFSSFNAKEEIFNIKPSFSLFSKLSYKKNYYELGCFNYLWIIPSNVHSPNNLISLRPNTKQYYEYVFSKNELKLIKHYYDGIHKYSYLFHGGYILGVDHHYNVSEIFDIGDTYQVKVYMFGTIVEYLEKIEGNKFRQIHIDGFGYSEETLELRNNIFYTTKTNKRILRNENDINDINQNRNPFTFHDNFIKNIIKFSRENGAEDE